MAETLAELLAAHLLADFVLQFRWMYENKRRPDVLLLHVLIVTALSALFIGSLNWPLLGLLFATHLAADAAKTWRFGDRLPAFLADQIFHLAVMAVLAAAFPVPAEANHLFGLLPAPWKPLYVPSLILVSGLVAAVVAGGYLVGKVLAPFADALPETPEGLKGAGAAIGKAERFLIFLLILVGQPAGIGFLVAAKSIMRIGEISQPDQRKMAEYIIIGTFLSFAWAILVGSLTQKALALWLP
jgi:hypothetical protein